jgi:hypothetical protein
VLPVSLIFDETVLRLHIMAFLRQELSRVMVDEAALEYAVVKVVEALGVEVVAEESEVVVERKSVRY